MAVREEKGVVRWRENNSSSVCIHVCDFACVCVCLFTCGSGHRCADSERAVCEHKSVTARMKKKKITQQHRLCTNKKNARACVSVWVCE